ncbi:MAG: ABC transporter substrate-binding protein [Nanoarchaeota archaeon]
MKKTWLGLILLVFLISCSTKQDESIIKWGFIAPLTGSSVTYGMPGLNSAKIAIDEINAAGGINGKKVELIVEDGKCEGVTAVTAAKKLIDINKVKVIFGGHCSTESIAIIPVSREADIFQIASTTSSPVYSGQYRYALRTTASTNHYAKIQAEVAWKKGYRTIAILEEQRDFPKAVVDSFSSRFKELGGSILAVETFAPESADFRTELLKLEKTNPDAFLVSTGGTGSTGLIFRQLKELAIEVPVMGNAVTINQAAWNQSGESMPSSAWAVTQHVDMNASPITKHFHEEYTRRFGDSPIDWSYTAESYDAIKLFAEFYAKCGYDNECLRSEFVNIKGRVIASGTVTFDENTEPLHKYALTHVENGKNVYEPIE